MGVLRFSRPRASAFGRRLIGAVFIAVFAAGCSGGGGSSATPPAPGQAPSKGTASVTFTMHWGTGSAAVARNPRYNPATARSVSVSVNGGTLQYLNAPTSTIVIDAPVGTDTFAFATYDGQNGQGNVLSRASVTQNIVLGTANSVTAVLNGVIASLVISLSNPSPIAGASVTVNVNVAARDADNNTIVGAGDYSTPINLTISDSTSSGTLSLSTNNIPNAATTATLTYSGGTLNSGLPGGPVATVVAAATGVPTVSAAFTPVPTMYIIARAGSNPGFTLGNKPQWIAAGSDGNMWFTENPGNAVARITQSFVVTEFTAGITPASNPQGITAAADGNLWFTEFAASKISRITTTGTVTEFNTLFAGDGPQLITERGDGTVWFAANTGNHVGFQGETSGVSGETTVPTLNSQPYGVAEGPDGYLYFTESAVDKIGRIPTLFGSIQELSLPANVQPLQIVRGAATETACGGGPCMWFTESGSGASRIGKLTPGIGGMVLSAEYPTVTPMANPTGITVGQDGALWFTEPGLDRIGRVTSSGLASEYISGVPFLGLKGIAVAPDGSLWFCEAGTGAAVGRIGRLVY